MKLTSLLVENMWQRSSTNSSMQTALYCRFSKVTFQSVVPKFVVNIPNYVSKFAILGMEVAKPTLQVAHKST
jgi:hypothetical protein